MNKKVLKTFGSTFAVLAIISLFFPWVCAYNECDLTTIGFGLTEFSAWGTVIIILPVIILGITHSKLNDKTKTIFLLFLFILGSISFYCVASTAINSIRNISSEYVKPEGWLFLYPVFIFLSLFSWYLCYNLKGKVYNKSEIDIGKLYLCPQPYTFANFKKGEGLTRFSGCVSFVTEDGYFAASGPDKIKDGCVEMFDGVDTAGFVMQMRTSGVYGAFYEGYNFFTDTKMSVASFNEIKSNNAELYIPTKTGFIKKSVKINPKTPVYITCKLLGDDKINTNIEGAVIVQNKKAVAVVSEYDTKNNTYNCISALNVALPLIYMVQEQKQLEKFS